MRYTFGDCALDTQRYTLEHAGTRRQLQPKVVHLLAYLIKHRDRVVPRQELFDAVWPAQVVSDDALEWTVAAARRAVGDSGRAQRLIKTVHGWGYRFIAAVETHSGEPSEGTPPTVPSHTLTVEEHPAVRPSVIGERKQVTVLACALSVMVTQAAGMEPETLHTVRQHIFALVHSRRCRTMGARYSISSTIPAWSSLALL